MRRRKNISKIITTSIRIGVVMALNILLLMVITLNRSYNELYSKYSQIDGNVINQLDQKNINIQILEKVITTLDKEIEDLSTTNKQYVDQINEFNSRVELFDKYEYAIINEEGNRTDLTYAQIKLGEQLMLENGYDPNLLFGTIMVESDGRSDAVNEYSDATGYGQLLNSTAKFIWNDLMGNTEYYPEIRKDGEENIKMMASYYNYLYSIKDNTFEVVKQYSGNASNEGAQKYLDKINNYTSQAGVIIN